MENKIILPSTYHNSTEERILCAAIWYKHNDIYPGQPKNIPYGYVMCGRRHHNIIQLHMSLTGEKTIRREWCLQGFLTSYDRWVDRKEANLIAIEAKQTKYNKIGEDLISEDLY